MSKRTTNKKGNISVGTTLMVLVVVVLVGVLFTQNLTDAKHESAPQLVSSAKACTKTANKVMGMELPQLDEVRTEQVIRHMAYTVSYNADWHLPNWVAYELTAAETEGDETRSDKFLPDPLVNGDPVVTSDYKGSGYDRGHMAPAADFRWSAQAMKESFYMTNMCPQVHANNAGDWKELEDLVRDLAKAYGTLYVVCGPIVGKHPSSIGSTRKILVPEAFYKVLLREEKGQWYSIGFVMQNVAQSKPLMTYMMTVNDIEEVTHIDFFPQLPDEVEEQVEGQMEPGKWSLKRK